MRVLLDTHVLLSWLTDDAALDEPTKALLDDEPDVFLSPVTVWEIAIKQARGKTGRLPPIHRDPFDRMLVAQARCEDLTLMTRDAVIARYDVLLRLV